jgi:NADH-quinone oxidoreductase subunit E
MECAVCHDMLEVDAIIDEWGGDDEYVIEMLQGVQGRFRYLPEGALGRISERTGADMGRLYHIATFYKAFSLKPRGEIGIQVCTGTACHVQGSARVLDAFSRELEVRPGESTADLKFSLDGVRCLGCCGLAPVVTIGSELIGRIDSSKVARLLKKHGKTAAGPAKRAAKAGAKEKADA